MKYKNKVLVIGIISVCLFLSVYFLNQKGLFGKFYKVDSRVKKISSFKSDREVYGWVKVQGTDIDYPVFFNDGSGFLSSVLYNYAWTNDRSKGLHNNVVLFGHNIRNVSSSPLIVDKKHERFEQLPSFLYYDFAKKNQYIQYTVFGKDYLYQIFSVSIVKDRFIDYSGVALSKKDFEVVVGQYQYDSYFDYGVKITSDDKIISLVTCTRFFGGLGYDIRISAKLVDKDVGVLNRVKEKKNYKKIKDRMATNNKASSKL